MYAALSKSSGAGSQLSRRALLGNPSRTASRRPALGSHASRPALPWAAIGAGTPHMFRNPCLHKLPRLKPPQAGSHWRPNHQLPTQGTARENVCLPSRLGHGVKRKRPMTREKKKKKGADGNLKRHAHKKKLQKRKLRNGAKPPAIVSDKRSITQFLEDLRREKLQGATWKKGQLFVDLFSGKRSPVGMRMSKRGGAVIWPCVSNLT